MYDYSSQHLDNSSSPFLSQSDSMLNNRYRVLKPLGQGGFGKTFLAVEHKQQLQTRNGSLFRYSKPQFCVIKQFFPERHNVDHYLKASELFRQESLLLKELGKHPQIPELLDFFEEDGQQYLVQEWIDGQTLEQELAEAGSFNEDEICQLLEMVLPVLQFVHEHQVIHRDIKPANIVRRRSDLQLVLVDFGSAKYAPSAIAPTTGTLIGSAEYASPEQIKGKAVFASDLYSLGVTCLHLLTQIPPFDLYDCGEDIWAWRSYLTKPINPSLEQIICKLLQKPIKRRYQSATEVLSDLNSLSKQKSYVIPSQPIARTLNDDDDFETPYFGLNSKENIPASMTVYSTALNIHSIAAVTVFDPQTQAWYRLPPKMEANEVLQKASAFLDSCLVIVDSPAQLLISSNSSYTMLKQSKKLWRVFAAMITTSVVCLTIAYFGLKMKCAFTPRMTKF
ncbi:serine/threonine protein kinase [Aetokthonos hydrillicola Thurmond2011]|uniref:non-specific serine/threonine protein kinase n=1 Tax=Aetokthonos hydrillicola Thurmond2011 TaxID=2712845 RepID=A0AAP5ID37_9CYAN|nr:serine/threonine-protein kinase [Aetokthonos hydrillicola]MBO3457983.1 serine/threonine protein kinase [Aetokthonos hydrillicola CCALA 1050]MBW4587183.1 serine/threonine protein kinase [Aetokthonos hydrillicola CCALA 1050]MDR9899351.1 serine/threonine protein kinase [Aetokthonos hydrillicola Thurmond2011]